MQAVTSYRRAMLGVVVCSLAAAAVAGDLTPPAGPVTGTMKTLQQVEPRTPIQTLPGSATALYTISQPGSYYLTDNIEAFPPVNRGPGSPLFAIEITTDGVTIDLRGFEINGGGQLASGVRITGSASKSRVAFKNMHITGGSFRNFTFAGIELANETAYSDGAIVDNINAADCAYGVIVSDSCTLRDCATVNCGEGMYANSGATFENCAARDGNIGFDTGQGAALINCDADDCGNGYNLFYDDSLVGCNALYCGSAFSGNSGFSFSNCNAQKCGSGFDVYGRSTFTACTVGSGGDFGFRCTEDCAFHACTVGENNGTGFDISGSGNRVEGCTMSRMNGKGIWLHDTTTGTTISGCTLDTCGDSGIQVDGSFCRVEGNNATFAFLTGIQVNGSSNLVIRNSAGACGKGNYSIAPGNTVGPIVTAANIATDSNPHSNYDLGAAPPAPRPAPAAPVKTHPLPTRQSR